MSQTTLTSTVTTSTTNKSSSNSNSSTNQNKKLPLIVDVAIDTNGKQLYQVHESSKLVRKEMPRSTNFAFNNDITDDGFFTITNTTNDNSASTTNPSNPNSNRKILDHLPNNNNNSNSFNKLDENDGSNLYHHHNMDLQRTMSHPTNLYTNSNSMSDPSSNNDYSNYDNNHNNNDLQHIPTGAYSRVQDNDIWSDDVEQAFEEVLRLIPKNGLNKIKIAGRSCGRNELISDYIFTKTGKYRTRKQVSSHIQVIKNLGQKLDIISLINDGPIFNTKNEQLESTKKFEEIFSKINLNKSLGFSDSMKRKNDNSAPSSFAMHLPATKRIRRKNSGNPLNKIKFSNFFMSVNDQYSMNPIVLTIQQNNNDVKSLKLKDNANISNRFPGLNDFKNCSHIPIIHNMVKVLLPQLPDAYNIDNGFNSSYALKYEPPIASTNNSDNIISTERSYNSFTCIYSYGKEVLKFDEDGIRLNQDRDFLTKFWKFFFGTLVDKSETDINVAFKGITIKQIIYEATPESVKQEDDASKVCKSKVKLVLLWEFAKVDECKDALTTTTKILLPPRISANNNNTDVSTQVYEYSQPAINSIENSSTGSSSSSAGHVDLNNDNLSATTVDSNSYNNNNNAELPFKPQVKLQKKFQSLQHLQPHQQYPARNSFASPQPPQSTSYPSSSPYAQYSMPPPQHQQQQQQFVQTHGALPQFQVPSVPFGTAYTHHPTNSMDYMMISSVHNGGLTAEAGNATASTNSGHDYQLGAIGGGYSEAYTGEF
ncbi:TEC1 Transcription activator TEC1 [Candida maltosa Xu316]